MTRSNRWCAIHTAYLPTFARGLLTQGAINQAAQRLAQDGGLLADKAVEMKLVEGIAPSTVFYILKKTKSNRTGNGSGASRS